MYASIDFPTKAEFREAVRNGDVVVAYSPTLGMPAVNGFAVVHGPWPLSLRPDTDGPADAVRRARAFPRWKARVEVRDMRVVAVH